MSKASTSVGRPALVATRWAIPGTEGLEHRIGGLEKEDVTGGVSYDPANHEHMVRTRAAKVAGIKPEGEDMILTGQPSGKVLVVGTRTQNSDIRRRESDEPLQSFDEELALRRTVESEACPDVHGRTRRDPVLHRRPLG